MYVGFFNQNLKENVKLKEIMLGRLPLQDHDGQLAKLLGLQGHEQWD